MGLGYQLDSTTAPARSTTMRAAPRISQVLSVIPANRLKGKAKDSFTSGKLGYQDLGFMATYTISDHLLGRSMLGGDDTKIYWPTVMMIWFIILTV